MEMPKIDSFWDEQLVSQAHAAHRHAPPAMQQGVGSGSGGTHSPYERNLNFATVAVEDGEYGFPKKKTVRDPLSHRIIEKRRRDRMNNCLADLARLLPPSSLRKGRGRIEKTEIVELAIKHLRHLQCHPCPMGDKCEFNGTIDTSGGGGGSSSGAQNASPPASCSSSSTSSGYHSSHEEQFKMGFQECLSEAMHYLVEQEGLYAGDAMCMRLVKHLNTHCDTVLRDHWGNQGKVVPGFRRAVESAKTSAGSSSSGYHPNGSSSGSDGNGGNDGEGTEPFALPIQNPPQSVNVESRHSSSVLDYEAENSCSSTPLSIETSDVLSSDGKNNGRSSSKPPIPSIICSHSSTNSRIPPVNSGSPQNGSTKGGSSDDGTSCRSSSSTAKRYKFKSNIKQRFTADCQVQDDGFIPVGQMNGVGGSGENDRDGDVISDSEEIREERISMDEGNLQSSAQGSAGVSGGSEAQSAEEESEVKSILQPKINSSRRDSVGQRQTGETKIQSISAVGNASSASTSSSSSSSLLDKTGCKNSTVTDLKSVVPMDLQSQKGRETTDMKPSPEELLSAIHDLSDPNHGERGSPTKGLPFLCGGEGNLGGKGVPAFALHEKGQYYIPLTIDKNFVNGCVSKLEAGVAPPLYPITISVCFMLNNDKKAKPDALHSAMEASVPNIMNDKQIEFGQMNTPIALPMIPSGGGGSTVPPVKTSRRVHRESSSFASARYGHSHGHQRQGSSKDSGSHHSRVSSSNSSTIGFGYQVFGSSPSSGGGYEIIPAGNPCTMGNTLMGSSSSGGSTPYHTNYQDRNTSSTSPLNDIGRVSRNHGSERESETTSISGRSNTGAESSGSSGAGGRSGRKRSISSSPSVSGSGGSLGYHSWHEKGSPSSPDFFSFHQGNTHALQQMSVHGHLPTGAVPPGGVSPITPRHGQTLSAFHAAEAVLREKEACYGHDKRSKKARSVDQSMEAKQN